MKIFQKFKKFIIWLSSGLVLTLIGNSIYDKIKGINLLKIAFDWFWNQLNVLTLTLTIIVGILIFFIIFKIKKGLSSEDKIEFEKTKSNSVLSSEEKIIKLLAKEIKEKNLELQFNNILSKVAQNDYEYLESIPNETKYFFAKGIIETSSQSRNILLTETGKQVRKELILIQEIKKDETVSSEDENLKKIIKDLKRDNLDKEFLNIVVKVNDICGDYTGFNLDPYLLKGLIVRKTKTEARGYNFYALTKLGDEVWKKLR